MPDGTFFNASSGKRGAVGTSPPLLETTELTGSDQCCGFQNLRKRPLSLLNFEKIVESVDVPRHKRMLINEGWGRGRALGTSGHGSGLEICAFGSDEKRFGELARRSPSFCLRESF